MLGKTIFLGIWLGLVSLVVFALYREETYVTPEGIAIAYLQSKAGKVQVRPENLIFWVDTVPRQAFYEGDYVSTDGMGKAIVKFTSGRMIEIDEDTQIQLSSQLADNGVHHIVTLLKGGLRAKSEPTSEHTSAKNNAASPVAKTETFVVRAGERAFTLSKNQDELKLVKSRHVQQAVVEFATDTVFVKPLANITNASPVLAAKTLVEEKLEPIRPMLSAKSPAAKAVKPKFQQPLAAWAPRLQKPNQEQILWTEKSLRDAAELAIRILPPPDDPQTKLGDAGSWRPVLEASLANGKEITTVLEGVGLPQPQLLNLRLRAFMAAFASPGAAAKNTSSEITIKVRAGSIVISGEQKSEPVYGPESEVYRLRSLRDLPAGGYVLAFDIFALKPAAPDVWFAQVDPGDGASPEFKYTVYVASQADLQKLAAILRCSPRFRVAALPPDHDTSRASAGAFVVRNDKIIAAIQGRDFSRAKAKALNELLGGDLVLQGKPAAFYGRVNARKLSEVIAASTDNKIYVVSGDSVVPISTGLLTKESAARRLILNQTSALASEEMRVLHVRSH